jgi:hypothetical protein
MSYYGFDCELEVCSFVDGCSEDEELLCYWYAGALKTLPLKKLKGSYVTYHIRTSTWPSSQLKTSPERKSLKHPSPQLYRLTLPESSS